jgi:hypothetical protein
VLIPGEPVHGSIVAFFSRLIDATKDWQDNLQSTLPGYRDRIVHVRLKSEEGGLNITMPRKLVLELGAYGALAGVDMRTEFDLDHRQLPPAPQQYASEAAMAADPASRRRRIGLQHYCRRRRPGFFLLLHSTSGWSSIATG